MAKLYRWNGNINGILDNPDAILFNHKQKITGQTKDFWKTLHMQFFSLGLKKVL